MAFVWDLFPTGFDELLSRRPHQEPLTYNSLPSEYAIVEDLDHSFFLLDEPQ
jgi:hypothetical protein